jgi:hypothetical protein
MLIPTISNDENVLEVNLLLESSHGFFPLVLWVGQSEQLALHYMQGVVSCRVLSADVKDQQRALVQTTLPHKHQEIVKKVHAHEATGKEAFLTH